MKKSSLFTKAVLIIIILHLFFLFPACGKKGDPIPPQTEQPKVGTSTEQPQQPKTGTTTEQPQQPKTGATPEQPGIQPGATPGK